MGHSPTPTNHHTLHPNPIITYVANTDFGFIQHSSRVCPLWTIEFNPRFFSRSAAHISRVFLFFGRIGYSDSSWRVSDGRRFGRPSCVTCLRSKGAKWAVLSGLYGCLYIEFSKLVGYEIKQVQEPFQFCIWLSGCWQYITKDVYF